PVVPALPQSALSAPVSPPAAPRSQPESTPWDSWYAPRRSPSPSPSTGPQPWPMPPGSVLPPPADPDATRIDGPDLLPYDDPATAMLGDLRPAPASGGPRRPRRPLVPVIVVAALLAVVAGIVIFRPHAGSTAAGTAPSTSSQDTRRQAAVQLSRLLAQ